MQFYRKFGGAARVGRYRALVALAYLSRAVVASLAGLFRPAWRPQAHRFRRLLLDLPACDRALVDAIPWAGRYDWETVIALER